MDAAVRPIADTAAVTEFITRWKGNTGSERANFQSFMRDLCGVLDLPLPDPGKIRWLRPDATQVGTELATEQTEELKASAPVAKGKATFPKAVPEQLKVLREALAERPHTVESLAELFKRKPRKSVEEGLLSLAAVGRAEHEKDNDTWYALG